MFKNHKKLNNKGFSLVELIVSVVILGIVVIPLLRAFTTSAMFTSKARKMGEATAAAQNIQEVIETYSVANMLANKDVSGIATGHMTNENVLNLLGVDGNDTEILGEKYLLINNLQEGNKAFNATVEFTSNSNINNKLIAQYTDMTGTYSQPYADNQNPDVLADNAFAEFIHNNFTRYKPYTIRDGGNVAGTSVKDFYRERSILVTVRSSPVDNNDPDEGYNITVSVDFTYKYWYKDTQSSSPTRKRTFNHFETYEIFPAGHRIKSYDEEVACYLMYYPFYEADATELIEVDVDEDNEDSELKFKLFLVKQWPMVNGVAAPSNHQLITQKDRAYRFVISEYHNSNFEIIKEDATHAHEDMMNIYTNANIYFDGTGSYPDYKYGIKTLSENRYFYFTKEAILKNQLVKTEVEDRYYNVIIHIYEADVDPKTSPNNYIYELKASKLK